MLQWGQQRTLDFSRSKNKTCWHRSPTMQRARLSRFVSKPACILPLFFRAKRSWAQLNSRQATIRAINEQLIVTFVRENARRHCLREAFRDIRTILGRCSGLCPNLNIKMKRDRDWALSGEVFSFEMLIFWATLKVHFFIVLIGFWFFTQKSKMEFRFNK